MGNPIDRIKGKMALVAGAGVRVAAKLEAEADALIAREGEVIAKADQAFAPHKEIMGAAVQQLDDLENALNQLTNGGPALDEPHETPVPPIVPSNWPHNRGT